MERQGRKSFRTKFGLFHPRKLLWVVPFIHFSGLLISFYGESVQRKTSSWWLVGCSIDVEGAAIKSCAFPETNLKLCAMVRGLQIKTWSITNVLSRWLIICLSRVEKCILSLCKRAFGRPGNNKVSWESRVGSPQKAISFRVRKRNGDEQYFSLSSITSWLQSHISASNRVAV